MALITVDQFRTEYGKDFLLADLCDFINNSEGCSTDSGKQWLKQLDEDKLRNFLNLIITDLDEARKETYTAFVFFNINPEKLCDEAEELLFQYFVNALALEKYIRNGFVIKEIDSKNEITSYSIPEEWKIVEEVINQLISDSFKGNETTENFRKHYGSYSDFQDDKLKKEGIRR